MRVAVILPCLDEEAAIADVIAGFEASLPTAKFYVIDNGSSDGTARIAKAAGAEVIAETMRGKGNAVRRALTAIDADIYLIADGDGTYDASRAPELIAALENEHLDMVVGVRRKAAKEAYRPGHEWGNRLFNRAIKAFFGSECRDVFSGYRVLSNRYVKSFPALSRGFEIETEMTVHAILLRMPVKEIDCDYGKRGEGSESKLNTYLDGIRIMRTIFNLLRHYRPLYFFTVLAGVLLAASGALFYPIFVEYLSSGLVPRFPTLIVSIGLATMSAMLLICGLILDTTTRTQLEIRRLIYLGVPRLTAVRPLAVGRGRAAA